MNEPKKWPHIAASWTCEEDCDGKTCTEPVPDEFGMWLDYIGPQKRGPIAEEKGNPMTGQIPPEPPDGTQLVVTEPSDEDNESEVARKAPIHIRASAFHRTWWFALCRRCLWQGCYIDWETAIHAGIQHLKHFTAKENEHQ